MDSSFLKRFRKIFKDEAIDVAGCSFRIRIDVVVERKFLPLVFLRWLRKSLRHSF